MTSYAVETAMTLVAAVTTMIPFLVKAEMIGSLDKMVTTS